METPFILFLFIFCWLNYNFRFPRELWSRIHSASCDFITYILICFKVFRGGGQSAAQGAVRK